MQLTQEQQAIINSTGDIKINAVAGSGKTTTVIEFARTRPSESKILYLAFNRSVKLEAQKKFTDKGLQNVKVETAHSLAYRSIVKKYGYNVRNHGYKNHELVELLRIKGNGEKHTEFVLANHIDKFFSYYCNSKAKHPSELNYIDVVNDPKASAFVKSNYSYIESKTEQLLSMMDNGETDITHDFYLKKFQLSEPNLRYDYILFDEGQDASPAMLDVFLKQKAIKLIVGDTHQQIYGWRFAVNSLEKADFKTYNLSTSFRFNQDIANLAMEFLKWKKHIGQLNALNITGKGQGGEIKSKAVLARTNLGLLLKAIEYVAEKKTVKKIYFEGNIHSYTYADEGASLYDVLNLYNEKHRLIRDKMIKKMKDLDDLEDSIDKTEDSQLAIMVEIVKKYGNRIPGLIQLLKDKHVGDDEKDKAEMIFSTVHRCKGMEYDAVQIVPDFINEEKLEKSSKEQPKESQNIGKLNEEVNLLYVAVTRTKNSVHIHESLLPDSFPASPSIHIMKTKKEEQEAKIEPQIEREIEREMERDFEYHRRKHLDEHFKFIASLDKAYKVDEIRTKHKSAYLPWTNELDDELTAMYCKGEQIKDMADYFGRTSGAIRSRIQKLELMDLYGGT